VGCVCVCVCVCVARRRWWAIWTRGRRRSSPRGSRWCRARSESAASTRCLSTSRCCERVRRMRSACLWCVFVRTQVEKPWHASCCFLNLYFTEACRCGTSHGRSEAARTRPVRCLGTGTRCTRCHRRPPPTAGTRSYSTEQKTSTVGEGDTTSPAPSKGHRACDARRPNYGGWAHRTNGLCCCMLLLSPVRSARGIRIDLCTAHSRHRLPLSASRTMPHPSLYSSTYERPERNSGEQSDPKHSQGVTLKTLPLGLRTRSLSCDACVASSACLGSAPACFTTQHLSL